LSINVPKKKDISFIPYVVDVFFSCIERTTLIELVFLIGCRVDRGEIADCKEDPIGCRMRDLDPNILIEGVGFMKTDVRGNFAPNITDNATKTYPRGFLILGRPKSEPFKVRDPRFVMLPSFN